MRLVRASALAQHPWLVEIAIGVGVYLLSVVVLAAGSERSLIQSAVLAAGVALVLVIPGWCLAVIAFPMRDCVGSERVEDVPRALDIIERMTLAGILSIVVTSGIVFVLSREVRVIGVSLTPRMLFGTLIAVSALLAAGVLVRLAPRARLHAVVTAVVILGVYAVHWRGVPVTVRTTALEALALTAALTIASVGRRIAARALVRFPALAPFARYCTIGVGNTALDFGIYTALTRGFPFWGRHYLLANAVSFTIVVTWSFYWNRRWAFAHHGQDHIAQYAKFVSATVL